MKKKKREEITNFNLNEFSDPHFVASLTDKEKTLLAKTIREEIIKDVAKNGGHLSSNLGVVELTIALNDAFDFNTDKLVFDIGHQAYAYKILTGRSLENLRKKDGISGFQKRSESPYDHFEAGHSSTSLSAAQGMAISRDLNGEHYDVVALIGDGSISNGVALEALNDIGHKHNKVIIVLNDNEMSIAPPTGAISKMFRRMRISPGYLKTKSAYKRLMFKTKFGYFIYRITWNIKNWFKRHLIQQNFFEKLGFNYIGLVDGHNFKALKKAFKIAKKQPTSVIVHVKTTKGKGYKFAESDKEGDWHGTGPFDIETGKQLKDTTGLKSWSEVYADVLEDVLDTNKDTVLINPGTYVGSRLDKIFKEHPGRAIDVGIAEEHAFTLASGLALSNKHPIISIYSTFMQRSMDQIIHDLARMNLSTTILVDRSGYVGADGETHQGIFDASMIMTIPNTTIAMASTPKIAEILVHTSLNHEGPFFIRYPRDDVKISEINYDDIEVKYGEWKKEDVNNGSKDSAIITYGPYFEHLKTALNETKKNVTLVNAIYQKPFDDEMINSLLNYKIIYILDAYSTAEGFVNALFVDLTNRGFKGDIITRALPVEFTTQDTIKAQLKNANLAIEDIVNLIK
jgi:1-deoxy-D-xylulose-5-phosphate synthase